ncbi:unnamed protein product, partial [Rotaria sp. Silwood2]
MLVPIAANAVIFIRFSYGLEFLEALRILLL